MEYFSEILDRKTGELVSISQGDWITITELGELFGVGRRVTRSILRQMDFMHVEGGGTHQRHRLSQWVIDREWGKRIEAKRTIPFDVVGPDAREWVAERWSQTVERMDAAKGEPTKTAEVALLTYRTERNVFRRTNGLPEMSTQEMVSWLVDYFPNLTQTDISSITHISQQLVSRYINKQAAQRRLLGAAKNSLYELESGMSALGDTELIAVDAVSQGILPMSTTSPI